MDTGKLSPSSLKSPKLALLAAGLIAAIAAWLAIGWGSPRAGADASPSASSSGVSHAARAVRTARHAAGGAAFELEWDRHRGKPGWEVTVAPARGKPVEVDLSRNGRRVIDTRRERHRDRDGKRARRAKISIVRAIRIADRRVGGRLSEAEIDRERGRLVWSVNFKRSGRGEVEIAIDARSGAVAEIERDDD